MESTKLSRKNLRKFVMASIYWLFHFIRKIEEVQLAGHIIVENAEIYYYDFS